MSSCKFIFILHWGVIIALQMLQSRGSGSQGAQARALDIFSACNSGLFCDFLLFWEIQQGPPGLTPAACIMSNCQSCQTTHQSNATFRGMSGIPGYVERSVSRGTWGLSTSLAWGLRFRSPLPRASNSFIPSPSSFRFFPVPLQSGTFLVFLKVADCRT